MKIALDALDALWCVAYGPWSTTDGPLSMDVAGRCEGAGGGGGGREGHFVQLELRFSSRKA